MSVLAEYKAVIDLDYDWIIHEDGLSRLPAAFCHISEDPVHSVNRYSVKAIIELGDGPVIS